MFWRKRNEGFEWREYVRTTILVRRKHRRERLDEAKAAAVEGVKHAGRRGLDLGAAGAAAAGQGVAAGMSAGAHGIAAAGRWSRDRVTPAARYSVDAMRAGKERLGPAFAPAGDFLREPRISLPLALIAVICAAAAAIRIATKGLDTQAIFAGTIALAGLALVLLPRIGAGGSIVRRIGGSRIFAGIGGAFGRIGSAVPRLPRMGRVTAGSASLAALALLATAGLGAAWYFNAPSGQQAHTLAATSARPTTSPRPPAPPPVLAGQATAVAGNSLRITGVTVVLDGVEAPEPGQSCRRGGRRWSCGAAARDALAREIRGRRVICDVTGTIPRSAGPPAALARCSANGNDIGASLVRAGHVFASEGFFARYGSLEQQARSAKAGLWAGEADRPAAYRAKRWEEAKRNAPEGCPIKGRIASGARTYVLPWSPSYNDIRVRSARGERWFCSEEEAQAAGWRPGAES